MKTIHNELVAEWINKEKAFLYKLGYAFIQDERLIEESVKQTLNGFKDLHEFSKDDFKIKFVNECLKQKRLDQTVENDNERYQQSLFLKYVLQMDTRQIAICLSVSEQMVDKYLILGLTSLFDEEQLRSCDTSISKLINYHEGLLSFSEYKEINHLLTENEQCRQLMEKLIDIIDNYQRLERTLKPSQYFLEDNKPLTEAEIKTKKRRQRIYTIVASLFLFVGVIISSISIEELKYKWKLWTSEQVSYGENVYISAIDQDIEITVTHVAADDFKTVLYYEIRDLHDKFHYNMEAYQDMFEIIEKDIWDGHWGDFYSRPRNHARVIDEDNVSQGRLFLPPIKNKQETVTVRFYAVEQIKKGVDLYGHYNSRNRERITGEWDLKVPVTKYERKIVEINETIEVMGKEVYFSHLEIAPTATFLAYKIENRKAENTFESHHLSFSYMEVNGKEYLPDFDVDLWREHNQMENWDRLFPFETIYYKQPKDLEIVLDRMHSNYDYVQEVFIDYDNIPMDFQILDNIVTIKEIKKGNPLIITLEEQVDVNRSYDHFGLNFHHENVHNYAYGVSSEGVWLDRQGNKYTSYDEIRELENQNDLRFISSEQKVELRFNNKDWDESMLPEKFLIQGYSKTYLISDRLKVQLN